MTLHTLSNHFFFHPSTHSLKASTDEDDEQARARAHSQGRDTEHVSIDEPQPCTSERFHLDWAKPSTKESEREGKIR